MLTTLRFNLLYYKLKLCFKHHLDCITFTCHKILMTSNRLKFSIFLKKHQVIECLYFECFWRIFNSPLLSKNIDIKKFVYYDNQRPLCKTSNVWWNICSTLKVLCSNQSSKSKAPMVESKFLNIHISHKTELAIINMLLNFKVAPHN
jgi:hypothetical protein